MTDLVLKELRYRQAQLDLKAERLRSIQRSLPATSARALPLARQVKEAQAHADSYAALIERAEEMR